MVSYQWNYVKTIIHAVFRRNELLTKTIFLDTSVFCAVSSSYGDVLGIANKLVEVHGKLWNLQLPLKSNVTFYNPSGCL